MKFKQHNYYYIKLIPDATEKNIGQERYKFFAGDDENIFHKISSQI